MIHPSRSTPAVSHQRAAGVRGTPVAGVGRRALLYMPGDSRRKIEKATTLDADSVCLDLEDGVALNQKEAARATIAAALKELDFGRSERLVRLNRFGSGLEAEDFAQTVESRPDGFVIPKAEQVLAKAKAAGKV
jgi:citrate lyase beta subunit